MRRVYRIASMFKDGLPQRFKVLRGNLAVIKSVLDLHKDDPVFQERHGVLLSVFGGENFSSLMSISDADCREARALNKDTLLTNVYREFFSLEALLLHHSDEALAAMHYPWLDSDDEV